MVKIQQVQQTGQFLVTIPRNLAIALGIKKGQEANWRINKAGNLELKL